MAEAVYFALPGFRMDTIYSLFPNADDLLKLAPEDVAPVLLKLALARQQGAGFTFEAVTEVPQMDVMNGRGYPFHKKQAVDQHITRLAVAGARRLYRALTRDKRHVRLACVHGKRSCGGGGPGYAGAP